jgi:hypothetical protein
MGCCLGKRPKTRWYPIFRFKKHFAIYGKSCDDVPKLLEEIIKTADKLGRVLSETDEEYTSIQLSTDEICIYIHPNGLIITKGDSLTINFDGDLHVVHYGMHVSYPCDITETLHELKHAKLIKGSIQIRSITGQSASRNEDIRFVLRTKV